MDFGKNLKRIRTDKKINQQELADVLNVSQKTISSWEVGRSEPSMGDIKKIADFMECTQEDLIGIQRTTGNISFEDILVKVNSLNMKELERLIEVIKQQQEKLIMIEKMEEEKKKYARMIKYYEEKINSMERK